MNTKIDKENRFRVKIARFLPNFSQNKVIFMEFWPFLTKIGNFLSKSFFGLKTAQKAPVY